MLCPKYERCYSIIEDMLHYVFTKKYKLMLSPIWKSSTGNYSCSPTWEQIRPRSEEVVWHKVVWYALAIPKHAFILWLVFRDALITKEKMCTWGFTGSTLCLSWFACQESRDHLFFSCSFSCRVWKSIMNLWLIV